MNILKSSNINNIIIIILKIIFLYQEFYNNYCSSSILALYY